MATIEHTAPQGASLGGVDLLDFDPAARALLGRMTAAEIKTLSRQAGAPICHIDEKVFPTDPREGAEGANEALRRTFTVEIDNAMSEVRDSLTIAVAMLSGGEELQAEECGALAWLLHRAGKLAAHEDMNSTEAQRRLYVALGGYVHGR